MKHQRLESGERVGAIWIGSEVSKGNNRLRLIPCSYIGKPGLKFEKIFSADLRLSSLNYIHLPDPRRKNAMASFAGRAAWYLARGAARKWGPWAARKYGGKAAGAIAAAGAGYASGKWVKGYNNNKRKRPLEDVGGRPANDDTRINLNSTYNAVSLYNKRSRKGRHRRTTGKVLRKKQFVKRVKKAVQTSIPWSVWSVTYSDPLVITSAPATTYGSQDVFGATFSYALNLCPGKSNDSGLKDVNHILNELVQWGHVENGAIVDDTTRNTDGIKMQFKARMNFDIQCFNSEFTDTNPLYVDIYECTAAKHIYDSGYSTAADAWTVCYTDINQPFTGNVNPVKTRKGEQPSDAQNFKKWWSIDKVTRIRIAGPAPFHYDLTSSGVLSSDSNATLESRFCTKGITKNIMMVVAPIMVTTMPAAYNFQITAINKHFKFKPLPYKGHTAVTQMINSNFVTAL